MGLGAWEGLVGGRGWAVVIPRITLLQLCLLEVEGEARPSLTPPKHIFFGVSGFIVKTPLIFFLDSLTFSC